MQATETTPGAANREVWEAGDYSVIGSRLVSMSEDLCETADIRGGQRVLDVATGNGNAALAAARRGAQATGIDIAPSLIDAARHRAGADGIDVDFVVGDAEQIDARDDSFDVVVSAVGVQFAADQQRTAAELVRVCRPDGRIALANWTPVDCWTEFPAVAAEFVPPPAGAPSPMTWGTEAGLRSLLGDDIDLQLHQRTFRWRLPSTAAYVDMLLGSYPPFVRAATTLDDATLGEFRSAVGTVFERWNEADDGTLVLPLRYVVAVIDNPGGHGVAS